MDVLIEEFVKNASYKLGISISATAKHIDDCIYKIASEFNTDYKNVREIVYTPIFMNKCIGRKCSSLEEEECYKSCYCAMYQGKCISRVIDNYEEINKDPDKYIQKLNTKELESLIELASFLFFNYEGGNLTNNSFDAMEYHLNKRLKQSVRRYQKIGAPPIERIRTKLPYYMPSLNKVKPNTIELRAFLNISIMCSEKLDGVSGMIVYKNGVVDGVYIRGDGEIGGDITYVKDLILFPEKVDGDLAIRGEFVIKKNIFREKYSNEYVNERSFVTAKLNSGYISPSLKDIDFVAYSIVNSTHTPQSEFLLLDSYNFKTSPHVLLTPPILIFDLIILYKKHRDSSQYLIDGLVLTINEKKEIPTTLENPKNSVAFKMELEEQRRETSVINVDWNISRHGRFVPVAIYNSVYVNNVRLHRATAFNAAHVRDWSLGKGTSITVVRSGDIIPQIVDVRIDESITPIFPDISRGEWHWNNKDIVLDDIENNKWVQIQRNLHFFETIEVPRLREATLTKLWEAGYTTIKSITNITPKDLIKIRGIGKKNSEQLHNDIHSVMRVTRLDRFIPASTTFTSNIGRKLIIKLLMSYPTILEDDPKTMEKTIKEKKIPGFGIKRIKSTVEGMEKFKKFLLELNEEDILHAIEYNKTRITKLHTNDKINGKLFVLTGFMNTNYELEDFIYDYGGDIVGVVTSNIEAIISQNPLDINKKMEQAYEFGIKVYTVKEFYEQYK